MCLQNLVTQLELNAFVPFCARTHYAWCAQPCKNRSAGVCFSQIGVIYPASTPALSWNQCKSTRVPLQSATLLLPFFLLLDNEKDRVLVAVTDISWFAVALLINWCEDKLLVLWNDVDKETISDEIVGFSLFFNAAQHEEGPPVSWLPSKELLVSRMLN